jgi:hypothetical protein
VDAVDLRPRTSLISSTLVPDERLCLTQGRHLRPFDQ